MKKEQPQMVVSVIVRAYMREKFIRQALDSVLAQQTTYPFEIIIGENHSSDNTLQICQEYADKYDNIILLAHKENIGAQRNLDVCIKAGTGKYIMACDGDDWWHNPNKIQLQVDFMEAHPECMMCHTDNDEYYEETGKSVHDCKKSQGIAVPEGMVQKEAFAGKVPVSWPTGCFRRDAFEKYMPMDDFIKLGMVGEDYPTWVILAAYGELRYLPVSTATYRIGKQSVTQDVDYNRILQRRDGDKNVVRKLYEMFPKFGTYHEDEYFDKFYSHQLVMAAYRANDYLSARKFAKEDRMPNWKTRMAYTWVTFKIARLIKQNRI